VEDVRVAAARVMNQLDRPLADTWGCSLHGHVVTLVERLGAVSNAVQRVAEGGGPDGREDLIKQLTELAANAVVMLVEASISKEEDDDFVSSTDREDAPHERGSHDARRAERRWSPGRPARRRPGRSSAGERRRRRRPVRHQEVGRSPPCLPR